MALPDITSIKDPRVVAARALASAKGRLAHSACQVHGEEALRWALSSPARVEHVFIHDKLDAANTQRALLQELRTRELPVYAVSSGILKKITETRYLIPCVGVVDVSRQVQRGLDPAADMVVVLDEVQDPGNVGTIVRTAAGFGIQDIATTTPDFDIHTRKAIAASRGHVFDTHLRRFGNAERAIAHLKQQGYQIVATSSYGSQVQSLSKLDKKPLALIVGNETHGVSPAVLDQADVVIQIPMQPAVESLNVGVATGISLYELKVRLVITMLTQYIRSTLGREVNVTGKLIQRAFDAALAGISPYNSRQVILMMVLKCDQTMTQAQAGRDTATFGDELEALLVPLVDDGLVERLDPATLRLTAQGDTLLGQLWGVVERSESQILEGFSEEERRQLEDYLKRLQANCVRLIGA